MKRWSAFVGGLCALVVVPALAGELPKQIGIQLNADVFAMRFAPQFGDDDFTGYGGAARANIAFNEEWNAQLDVQGQTIQFGPFTADDAGQYLHLYARDPASHAVGIYGGHATFVSPFFSIDQTTIGAEAQKYIGQLTLYGQGAYSHLTSGPTSADLFTARGQARWFVTDNASIAADLMWGHLDTHADFVADFQTAAATAMVRLDNSPAALFGSLRYDNITIGGSGQIASWTSSIGVRLLLDPSHSTLKSSLRTGPAMDVLHVQFLTLIGGGG
jgi:hypothetical protein